MHDFVKPTPIINWQHPAIMDLARQLASTTRQDTARHCFEWVRDQIKHSGDHQLGPVTCTASEVLQSGTGFCYAKSHLLAALLRANRIPAGLCYQRLSLDSSGTSFCLHGLNAVHLPDFGWYRLDPRGNKPGISARFDPPTEYVAFQPQRPGETDLPDIYSDPLPQVVLALQSFLSVEELANNLPDMRS